MVDMMVRSRLTMRNLLMTDLCLVDDRRYERDRSASPRGDARPERTRSLSPNGRADDRYVNLTTSTALSKLKLTRFA
jgi:hypothetical protein